ncbi:MAG: hypothetical protein NTNFB01_30110 [Nitrospira sp.]
MSARETSAVDMQSVRTRRKMDGAMQRPGVACLHHKSQWTIGAHVYGRRFLYK